MTVPIKVKKAGKIDEFTTNHYTEVSVLPVPESNDAGLADAIRVLFACIRRGEPGHTWFGPLACDRITSRTFILVSLVRMFRVFAE